MKTLVETISSRQDFEDFIYEEKSQLSFNYASRTIYFGGGLFYYDETETMRDIHGFPEGQRDTRKFCTIECVRRALLERQENDLFEGLDSYDEDKWIAKMVYYQAV